MSFKKVAVTLLALSLLAGCSSKQTQSVEHSTQKLEQSAKAEGKKLVVAVENDSSSLKVKTGLLAASKLDSKNIHVDQQGKTLRLRGSVSSQEQKNLAERIARQDAGKGELVVNDLRVEGKHKS